MFKKEFKLQMSNMQLYSHDIRTANKMENVVIQIGITLIWENVFISSK